MRIAFLDSLWADAMLFVISVAFPTDYLDFVCRTYKLITHKPLRRFVNLDIGTPTRSDSAGAFSFNVNPVNCYAGTGFWVL